MSLVVMVVLSLAIRMGSSAKILGIVPTPSYSHQVVSQPLWRELSLRGHQVTTLTTDPIKDPQLTNLTEVDLHFSYDIWNKHIMDTVFSCNKNAVSCLMNLLQQMFDVYEGQLNHPSLQTLINGDDKFDLIIIEAMWPPMFAFVEKYKCPVIGILSFEATSEMHKLMGNPTHSSIYPQAFKGYGEKLTLLQRVDSFVTDFATPFVSIYVQSVVNNMIKKHFGKHYSPVDDIMQNISLLFVNTDPIFHMVRPLVPSVIEIGGGSHLKPLKPLPTDLGKLLDDAKGGFIYFSLGSNVKSKDIPLDLQNKIIETFAELPYTILWKFEAESLPNKPNNVFVYKWLPQQDVLRHPNIKLFITQGGLQSLDEATYSGVPLVVIPFFVDQDRNAQRIVDKGMGLSMDYNNFDKAEFKEIILEVINNSTYRTRIKYLAKLAQDQPMTGLERAVWWTEYVIRHKGAEHLRSPLKDIPLYQYLLLDVIGVLLISFIAITYIFYAIARLLWRRFSKLQSKDKKIN